MDRKYERSANVPVKSVAEAWALLEAGEQYAVDRFGEQADHRGVDVQDEDGQFRASTVQEARAADGEAGIKSVNVSVYRLNPDDQYKSLLSATGRIRIATQDLRHFGSKNSFFEPRVTVDVEFRDRVEAVGVVDELQTKLNQALARCRQTQRAAAALTPISQSGKVSAWLHRPLVASVIVPVIVAVLAGVILFLLFGSG